MPADRETTRGPDAWLSLLLLLACGLNRCSAVHSGDYPCMESGIYEYCLDEQDLRVNDPIRVLCRGRLDDLYVCLSDSAESCSDYADDYMDNDQLERKLTEAFLRLVRGCNNQGFNVPRECRPLTCRNGGTCRTVKNQFQYCDCPAGFTGRRCEHHPNQGCPMKPCKNGGSCLQSANTPTCTCPSGYSGRMCEVSLREPALSQTVIIAIAAGGGTFLIILAIIIAAVCVIKKSKSQKRPSSQHDRHHRKTDRLPDLPMEMKRHRPRDTNSNRYIESPIGVPAKRHTQNVGKSSSRKVATAPSRKGTRPPHSKGMRAPNAKGNRVHIDKGANLPKGIDIPWEENYFVPIEAKEFYDNKGISKDEYLKPIEGQLQGGEGIYEHLEAQYEEIGPEYEELGKKY